MTTRPLSCRILYHTMANSWLPLLRNCNCNASLNRVKLLRGRKRTRCPLRHCHILGQRGRCPSHHKTKELRFALRVESPARVRKTFRLVPEKLAARLDRRKPRRIEHPFEAWAVKVFGAPFRKQSETLADIQQRKHLVEALFRVLQIVRLLPF